MRASLCGSARVITTRLPTSELEGVSGTLTGYLFENGLRAGFNEQPRHVLAELCRLFRQRCGMLLHTMHAVHGTHARIHHQLTVLDARICTYGYLAPAVQRS